MGRALSVVPSDGDPDQTGGDALFAFATRRPGGNGSQDDIWIAKRDCQ